MEPTSVVASVAERADRIVSRRCVLAGAGGVGAAVLLAACSSGSSGSSGSAARSSAPTAASTSAGNATTAAGTSAAGGGVLAHVSDIPVGGTATVTVDGQTVLLSQPKAGTIDAFSAVCPHQGATVRPDGAIFRCPLHGSQFNADGSLRQGPAPHGLTAIAVRVDGDSVVRA